MLADGIHSAASEEARLSLCANVSETVRPPEFSVVHRGAPEAQIIFDRFHVQRFAQDAVDQVRRDQVRLLAGSDDATALKTAREEDKLADVQRVNRPLYRAYLLKESLAAIFDRRQVHVAREKFLEWCGWAARSRLPPFKKVAKTIRRHLDGILAFIATGLSNGPIEGLNGKIRTITRRAYGFHSARSLISFIFLCCSGLVLHPVFKTP
jgi:transposase